MPISNPWSHKQFVSSSAGHKSHEHGEEIYREEEEMARVKESSECIIYMYKIVKEYMLLKKQNHLQTKPPELISVTKGKGG